MLNDEILEQIFADKEMQMIPIGCQSTAVSVFEKILEDVRKENPFRNSYCFFFRCESSFQ